MSPTTVELLRSTSVLTVSLEAVGWNKKCPRRCQNIKKRYFQHWLLPPLAINGEEVKEKKVEIPAKVEGEKEGKKEGNGWVTWNRSKSWNVASVHTTQEKKYTQAAPNSMRQNKVCPRQVCFHAAAKLCTVLHKVQGQTHRL